MNSEDQRLRELGIHVITDSENPLVRAECIRIARRIHLSGNQVIGFIPAADDISVPPVAIQLGVALTEITGATVAVVDANMRWPGLVGLADEDDEPSLIGMADELVQEEAESSVFRTKWLRGSLALLSPPQSEQAGDTVPQLARLLLAGADLFGNILVDLTGFDLLGEHASAAACMDSTILLGRARKTRETELLAMEKAMPKNRFMGVLLIGS